MVRVGVADKLGDLLDRIAPLLQQLAGLAHPQRDDVLFQAGSDGLLEDAGEVAAVDVQLLADALEREPVVAVAGINDFFAACTQSVRLSGSFSLSARRSLMI